MRKLITIILGFIGVGAAMVVSTSYLIDWGVIKIDSIGWGMGTGFVLIAMGILLALRPSAWRLARINTAYQNLTREGSWDSAWKADGGAIALDNQAKRVALVDIQGNGRVFNSDEILGYSSAMEFKNTQYQNKRWWYADFKTSDYSQPIIRVWFGNNQQRMNDILGRVNLICNLS